MSQNAVTKKCKDIAESCCGWTEKCKSHEIELRSLNTSGHMEFSIDGERYFILSDEQWAIMMELWEKF